jgi:lactate dehydrogenase-like 2-hydroxyacid dehydrogenase
MIEIYYFERPSKRVIKKYIYEIKFIKIDNVFKNFSKVEILYLKLDKFVNKNFLDRFIGLKYILSPTTGDDHFDKKYLKKKNLKLLKLSPKSSQIKKITSTGEYTLTLILNSVRKLFNYRDNFIEKNYNRYCYDVFQFKNYTVGIIGTGRIGKYIIKKLKNLSFKIITYDNSIDHINKLKFLIKKSDIVSLNIPAEKNLNFFDKIKLSLMKKNSILINTSRGELIDENQLLSHLKKNKNFYAVLDVIKNEQKNKNKKLIQYNKKKKNLVILPHLGGATIDAMEIADDYIVQKILKIKKY